MNHIKRLWFLVAFPFAFLAYWKEIREDGYFTFFYFREGIINIMTSEVDNIPWLFWREK